MWTGTQQSWVPSPASPTESLPSPFLSLLCPTEGSRLHHADFPGPCAEELFGQRMFVPQALLGHQPCCWGSPEDHLLETLRIRTIRAAGRGRQVFRKPCSQAECDTRRDCLAKLVYARWAFGPALLPDAPVWSWIRRKQTGSLPCSPAPGDSGGGCWASWSRSPWLDSRGLCLGKWPQPGPDSSVLFGDRSLPSPWRWAEACLAGRWQGRPRGDVRSSQVQAQTCG